MILCGGSDSGEENLRNMISNICTERNIKQLIEIYLPVMPVAGSIFGPLSQTDFSKSEFKNEISSSVLLDMELTLLCVCGVNLFFSELEHLIEKKFHGLFSKKKPLKPDSSIQIHEMKLRSTSSAEKTLPTRLLGLLEKRSKI